MGTSWSRDPLGFQHDDVVVHINGVLHKGDYHVSIATDGKSVLWQCGVQSICFTKNILKSILKRHLFPLEPSRRHLRRHRSGDENQEGALPKSKQFWGAPQVMHIKWECTGTFSIIKRDYEIDYAKGTANATPSA